MLLHVLSECRLLRLRSGSIFKEFLDHRVSLLLSLDGRFARALRRRSLLVLQNLVVNHLGILLVALIALQG